jgi:hypothetical protein
VLEIEDRLGEAGADDAAVRLREQRLRELVAAVRRVVERPVERMLPVEDPRIDVAHVRPEVIGTRGKQDQPQKREREAPCRDVEQRQEGAEEHQRRPNLARDQQHTHRRAPHEQQRSELLHRGQCQPENALPRGHKQLPVVAQVGGEEDDDCDLPELGWLERDRSDMDAQVGAVDLLTDAG